MKKVAGINYLYENTPRKIGLENNLNELKRVRGALHEMLKEKELVYADNETLIKYLDRHISPAMFNDFNGRERSYVSCEEIAIACVLHGAIAVAEAVEIITKGMITLTEYAQKYDKPPVIVRQKCLRGNVPGAVHVGRDWMMPEAEAYIDFREKQNVSEKENLRKTNKTKDYYAIKTPRQIAYENDTQYLDAQIKECIAHQPNTKNIIREIKQQSAEEIVVKLDILYNLDDESKYWETIATVTSLAMLVKEADRILFENMLTLKEYAQQTRMNPDVVRQKCLRGNVEGAFKTGSMWFVPQSTIYK